MSAEVLSLSNGIIDNSKADIAGGAITAST